MPGRRDHAGDPRRWPPEKFAAVGDALARVGARVVIIGAYEESELIEAVVQAMQCPALNLHRSLSLGGLAALLAMLNSCASGVAVMNIDNGFGAGYVASLINRKRE